MNRPVIAVTTSYIDRRISMSPRYFEALWYAGAIPVLLDRPTDDAALYAEEFDGFLFAGGVDVHPRRYGEEILPECGEIDEERDESELILLDAVLRTGKPILGICRGIQLLNVGLGGTLYQHIDCHTQSNPSCEPSHGLL